MKPVSENTREEGRASTCKGPSCPGLHGAPGPGSGHPVVRCWVRCRSSFWNPTCSRGNGEGECLSRRPCHWCRDRGQHGAGRGWPAPCPAPITQYEQTVTFSHSEQAAFRPAVSPHCPQVPTPSPHPLLGSGAQRGGRAGAHLECSPPPGHL